MSVLSFVPLHAKLKVLIDQYLGQIEASEDQKAYMLGWLEKLSQIYYEEFLEAHEEDRDVASLVAEMAFWKAMASTYRAAGKFVLADKLGFMPPKI